MSCKCPSPKPMWSVVRRLTVCSNCLEHVEPLPESKDLPLVLNDPKVKSTQKFYHYLCPQCDHEELYFPQLKNPEGTAKCQLCGYRATGAEITKAYADRERDYQEKLKDPMNRTIGYVTGKYGTKPKPPEC